MSGGWFAVKRGITTHEVFVGRPDRLLIWMWLLDNAAWKDTKHDVNGKVIVVPRGCVSASERRIARETGLGYQVIRTFLSQLKTERMINAEVVQGRNLIRLCNWDVYQLTDKPANAPPNAPPNAGLTHDQRTKEQGNNTKQIGKSQKDRLGSSLSSDDDDQPKPEPEDQPLIDEAVRLFKAAAARNGWPSIKAVTPSRRAALRARLREGGLDEWREALAKAEASSHCNGQNSRGWVVNFDFLVRQSSNIKLLEGAYDDRERTETNGRIRDSGADRARHAAAIVEQRRMARGQGGGSVVPLLPARRPD